MANLLTFAPRTLFTLGISAMCFAAPARAQTRWFVSTHGADTLWIERFERAGNKISGLWVTYHGANQQRDIVRHEYTIVVAADDRPRSVRFDLRHPDSAVLRTYDARFSDDSVVITLTPDTLPARRLAAHRAYPLLGGTMSMYELLIAAARAGKQPPDSGAVVAVLISGPFVARPMPIALVSANSVRLGGPGGPMAYMEPHGAIDSLVTLDGSSMRQVGAFDIDAVARAAFRDAPPKSISVPVPARTEIALPAAALQRFVGTYQLQTATLIQVATLNVTLNGDALSMQVVGQESPPLRLFAEAPTKFFLKVINAEVEFEVDAAGNTSGLMITQNGRQQRAAKMK